MSISAEGMANRMAAAHSPAAKKKRAQTMIDKRAAREKAVAKGVGLKEFEEMWHTSKKNGTSVDAVIKSWSKGDKRIKGSIPIFPSKRSRKKLATKRRWTKANPVKESAAKEAEELAFIARRELSRKGAALNIIRQVLQLLED